MRYEQKSFTIPISSESERYRKNYDRIFGRRELDGAKLEIVVCDEVPGSELHLVQDGKVLGKIVNMSPDP